MNATFQSYLSQLRRNPLDVDALEAVRDHAERSGESAGYAEALELRAKALAEVDGDPVERGRLHFELGNLYRDQLGRPDRAIVQYRAAVDADATQRPALAAARGIYAEAGKWDQVAKLLDREAESLPPGPKRSALLLELASLRKGPLGDLGGAIESLREAIGHAPDDLHASHELVTLLLELADENPDPALAEEQRREAADILCRMAEAVSDDYAFAYIEAALDATPDHAAGMELLEQVAPRVGRSDTIPPRWVAGLQTAPEGPISRDLRLKLARAYHEVGQASDAELCLDPLIAQGDVEAELLRTALDAPRVPSTITDVDDSDVIDGEPSQATSFVPDLLAEGREEGDSASPLDDLSRLTRLDQDLGNKAQAEREEVGDIASLLSSSETSVDERERAAPADSAAHRLAEAAAHRPHSDEAVTPSHALSMPVDDVGTDDVADEASYEERDVHGEVTQRRSTLDLLAEVTRPRGDFEIPPEARISVSAPNGVIDLLSEAASQAAPEPPDPTPSNAAPSSPQALITQQETVVSRAPTTDLIKLRGELEKRLRFRDRRGAAEIGEAILQHDVADEGAISALEDHYRATRDFKRMRELAMRIAREASMPVETRVMRLREAAMLSESKLGDQEGTVEAWRALLFLQPLDEEGTNKLRKLFTRSARWDDLAQLIELRARATPDSRERAGLFRELGALHRDKRKAPDAGAEAFKLARELDPRPDDDVALSELLLAAERFAEGATLYEARLASTDDPVERIPLLRVLADVYESKLRDDARARVATEALLGIVPRESESLERLERIAQRLDEPERLIDALSRRLEASDGKERVPFYARIASIAEERLGDPSRAADAYRAALGITPEDASLRGAAARAFDAAGRHAEYTALLDDLTASTEDPTTRARFLRELAERKRMADDREGAIAVYELLIDLEPDRDALRDLVDLLRATDRSDALAERLETLAAMEDERTARDLRVERARLFMERRERLELAKAELLRVLDELAPSDVQVLELLRDLAKRTNDLPLYGRMQEKLLALAPSAEQRVELAEALVELYEGALPDEEGAVRALEAWRSAAPAAPQPWLKLLPYYERSAHHGELLEALDALSALAVDEEEASEFLLRAARVAMARGDYEGAWRRLVPRVADSGDIQAEEALRELAEMAGRGVELAELYVGLAQRDIDPAAQTRRWMDAAYTYEAMVNAPDKALEAALRALAKDLTNLTLLDEADRLAEIANAWPRLQQVYDAIVRRAETVESRVRALMRHAALLEAKAKEPAAALERAVIAFHLDPNNDDTYRAVKRLARASNRNEDLLQLHERRASSAHSVESKVEALLEACAVAAHSLSDTPRATGTLSRAVMLVGSDEHLLERIESNVRALDQAQPPIDGRGLNYALAEVYKLRAEEGRGDVKLSALLLSRAARIYGSHLDDREAAYRALERAATIAPADETLLDTLFDAAERAQRFDTLAEHYQRVANDSIDSNTASAALKRLGALVRGPLKDPRRAAAVYNQLSVLKPRDLEAAELLRTSLREAKQHKDLLAAIDRQLALSSSTAERVTLLKEAAITWETDLSNRFEARDAWKKVIALDSNDADARAGLERLGARASVDERSLLDSSLVVLPEDLHPSIEAHSSEPGSGEPAPAPELASVEAKSDEPEPEPESEPAPELASVEARSDEPEPALADASPDESEPAPADASSGDEATAVEPAALEESAELAALEDAPETTPPDGPFAGADEDTDPPQELDAADDDEGSLVSSSEITLAEDPLIEALDESTVAMDAALSAQGGDTERPESALPSDAPAAAQGDTDPTGLTPVAGDADVAVPTSSIPPSSPEAAIRAGTLPYRRQHHRPSKEFLAELARIEKSSKFPPPLESTPLESAATGSQYPAAPSSVPPAQPGNGDASASGTNGRPKTVPPPLPRRRGGDS